MNEDVSETKAKATVVGEREVKRERGAQKAREIGGRGSGGVRRVSV